MPTLPGTNYCGPFNSMDKKTLSKVDKICKRHDQDYQQIINSGRNPYLSHNWADKDFLRRIRKLTSWDWQSVAAFVYFYTKEKVFPHDNEAGKEKRQQLLTEMFPQTKRLKVDIPDNIPDLPNNIEPYLTARSLMYGPMDYPLVGTHGAVSNEYHKGLTQNGPYTSVPRNYIKAHKFHFREVAQFTTSKTVQVKTGELAIINNTDLKYFVDNVPIRYYDEVLGLPDLKTGSVSLGNPISVADPGNFKFHFDVEFYMYFKNNSTTEARIHMKVINYTAPTNTLWQYDVTQAMNHAFETSTPTVPFGEDPKHDLLNWHPMEKDDYWKYGAGKYWYLQPGQSTTVKVQWSFITDNPYATTLNGYAMVQGCKSLAYRVCGDIGHYDTSVALVPVNAIDIERETKITCHISHATYRNKIATTLDSSLYTTNNAQNVNEQGDMVLEG